MEDRRKLVAIVLIILLVGVGAYLLTKDNDTSSSSETSTQPQNTTQTESQTPTNESESTNNEQKPAATTITYDGTSFSPSSLTVKSGATVTVKNTSDEDLQFDSDPHPVHTDDTDLNVGAVPAGGSMTFTATKKGTFGFHNHLDPTEKGTITIE